MLTGMTGPLVILLIVIVVVLIALLLFCFFTYKKHIGVIRDQIESLQSLADIYYSMHIIDLTDMSATELEAADMLRKIFAAGNNAVDIMKNVIHATMTDEYLNIGLRFADVTTLAERLKGKKSISMDLHGRNVGWIRMSFIVMETDGDGIPAKVIVTTQIIDEDKKRELELNFQAHNDELTGLYNRRSYEIDLQSFSKVPSEEDFVYASIDMNGLKVINDSLGHAAGDELITGAADCLKHTVGNYGKVYRTGGDEFVAIFFANEEHLQQVITDLRSMVAEWRGTLTDSLSLAIGYASKREFPKETVDEMAKIADQRMYEEKRLYYAEKGIDRRGQAAAHTALCNRYTKIMKVNLTLDTYTVVNMDLAEQAEEKDVSNKLSQWISGFGKSGRVHPEDVDEYLRQTDIQYLKDYFNSDKTSIAIFYRRKFEDCFKQVMMEMIPADDYAEDNQSLYLYVKTIDK